MTSFNQQQIQQPQRNFSTRANIFLFVNLGCEMLYVVDQRLKAQQIPTDKSIQVIHDITAVFLEPKFIDSIIIGSMHQNAALLTSEHCKFMLKDAATCSLMQLDDTSMEKLWNLMTMLFKWQLFLSKYPHHLIDITFRHLNSIAKLYPDPKRNILIDYIKNRLLDFWNATTEDEQLLIYQTNISWLKHFNVKISVLIRLGFQTFEGIFVRDVDVGYYQEFVDSIGDNVYAKSVEIAARQRVELKKHCDGLHELNNAKYGVEQLAELLNCTKNDSEDLKPIDVSNFQQQFVESLQQCNVLFEDSDLKDDIDDNHQMDVQLKKERHYLDMKLFPDMSTTTKTNEFVQMKPIYHRESGAVNSTTNTALKTDLLQIYSKMK